MNNDNVDIFIYSHKPFEPLVNNPVYKVLTNSTEEIKTNLNVYRDYEGDNIAEKNLMFNEYTGLYWLWKNYELKDYIGLNHYRRYYSFLNNVPDINMLLGSGVFDIALNEPLNLDFNGTKTPLNNRDWYAYWHNVEDYDKFVDLIIRKFPEYKKGVEEMGKSTFIFPSSMFTMKKETFIEYCDYIFSVLDEYMKENGLFTTDDCIKHVEENKEKYLKPHLPYYTVEMQSRIIGYIAERALQTFLMNGENSLYKRSIEFKWILTK